MARVSIDVVAFTVTGDAVAGASAVVRKRADNSPATVWSAETGGTSLGSTLSSNSTGDFVGWLDRGAYSFSITGSSLGARTVYRDYAPAGDQTIDTAWLSGTSIPIGGVLIYPAANDPSPEWLICDGRAISRTTYSTLFARYGTIHGAGNGSTTFNIPNFASRSPLGAGTGSGLSTRTLGATGGAENTALTEAQLPAHSHSIQRSNLSVSANGGGQIYGLQADSGTTYSETQNTPGQPDNVSGAGHSNMQPWLATNFVVRAL